MDDDLFDFLPSAGSSTSPNQSPLFIFDPSPQIRQILGVEDELCAQFIRNESTEDVTDSILSFGPTQLEPCTCALSLALYLRKAKTAQTLLRVHRPSHNEAGQTALMFAIAYMPELAPVLLGEQGIVADTFPLPNGEWLESATALSIAVCCKRSELIPSLLGEQGVAFLKKGMAPGSVLRNKSSMLTETLFISQLLNQAMPELHDALLQDRCFMLAQNNEMEQLQALITDRDELIYIQNILGQTLVHAAAAGDAIDVLIMLCNHGLTADHFSIIDKRQQRPIDIAVVESHVRSIEFLALLTGDFSAAMPAGLELRHVWQPRWWVED